MGVKVARKKTYIGKGADGKPIYKLSEAWWIFVDHKGSRKALKVGNRDVATAKAKEIEAALTLGKLDLNPPETSPTVRFGEYADKWMAGYVEHNLKWNSRRYYADMLKRIPDELKSKPMEEITRDDVRNLAFGVIGNDLSRSTAIGLMRTLSAVFNSAAEDGVYRGANPALNPGRILKTDDPENDEVAEDAEETDCMTWEESKHFLKVAEKHFGENYPLYKTALYTAARQGELIALAWDSIDWKGSFLTIKKTAVNGKTYSTKNRRKRNIPIPALVGVLKEHKRVAAAAALASGKPMSRWVFPSPTGELMDPSKLRKEFKKGLLKAEIRADLTFHSLRHTALTAMADSGVPIASLQRIAGHSSIEITARYYLKSKPENHEGTLKALMLLDKADPPGESPESATPAQPSPHQAESPDTRKALIALN